MSINIETKTKIILSLISIFDEANPFQNVAFAKLLTLITEHIDILKKHITDSNLHLLENVDNIINIKNDNYYSYYISVRIIYNNGSSIICDESLNILYKEENNSLNYKYSLIGNNILVHVSDNRYEISYHDIINLKNNTTVKKDWVEISFDKEYLIIKCNNRYGLYDKELNEILEPIYYHIYKKENFFICLNKETISIFSINLSYIILTDNYSDIKIVNDGVLLLSTDKGTSLYSVYTANFIIENNTDLKFLDNKSNIAMFSVLQENGKYSILYPIKNKVITDASDSAPLVDINHNFILCTIDNKVIIRDLYCNPLIDQDKSYLDLIYSW